MATSTVIPVRKRSPQDITARALAVLVGALSVHDEWTREPEARQEIRQACEELHAAVEDFRLVESREVSWEAYYQDLLYAADPHGEALERLAEEASVVMTILLMNIGGQLADAIITVTADGGDGR